MRTYFGVYTHTKREKTTHSKRKHTNTISAASNSKKHIVQHTKSFFDGSQLKETIKGISPHHSLYGACVYVYVWLNACVQKKTRFHCVHIHLHQFSIPLQKHKYMRANNHTKSFMYVSKFPQNNTYLGQFFLPLLLLLSLKYLSMNVILPFRAASKSS